MTRSRLVLLSVAMLATACAGPVPSPAPATARPSDQATSPPAAVPIVVLSPNGQRQLGPDDAKCSRTIDIVADQPVRIEAVFGAGSCEIDTSA